MTVGFFPAGANVRTLLADAMRVVDPNAGNANRSVHGCAAPVRSRVRSAGWRIRRLAIYLRGIATGCRGLASAPPVRAARTPGIFSVVPAHRVFIRCAPATLCGPRGDSILSNLKRAYRDLAARFALIGTLSINRVDLIQAAARTRPGAFSPRLKGPSVLASRAST